MFVNEKLMFLCDAVSLAQHVDEKLRRKMTIARLPNVKRVNGSSVSDEERESANRAFIRYYVNEETKPSRYM